MPYIWFSVATPMSRSITPPFCSTYPRTLTTAVFVAETPVDFTLNTPDETTRFLTVMRVSAPSSLKVPLPEKHRSAPEASTGAIEFTVPGAATSLAETPSDTAMPDLRFAFERTYSPSAEITYGSS